MNAPDVVSLEGLAALHKQGVALDREGTERLYLNGRHLLNADDRRRLLMRANDLHILTRTGQ
jgi:hypothetical protein